MKGSGKTRCGMFSRISLINLKEPTERVPQQQISRARFETQTVTFRLSAIHVTKMSFSVSAYLTYVIVDSCNIPRILFVPPFSLGVQSLNFIRIAFPSYGEANICCSVCNMFAART
jgi:hypothetical protein